MIHACMNAFGWLLSLILASSWVVWQHLNRCRRNATFDLGKRGHFRWHWLAPCTFSVPFMALPRLWMSVLVLFRHLKQHRRSIWPSTILQRTLTDSEHLDELWGLLCHFNVNDDSFRFQQCMLMIVGYEFVWIRWWVFIALMFIADCLLIHVVKDVRLFKQAD